MSTEGELRDEDLDVDEDGVARINDEPVTGDVYERMPDGTLLSLTGYRNGRKHGWERDYHPDGRLSHEGRFEDGAPMGVHRHWYANGRPRSENEWSRGFVVRYRRWNEDGTLKSATPEPPRDEDAGPA